MRYFETQNGDYVAIQHVTGFETVDYGEDNLVRFALRATSANNGWLCGKYETKDEADSAKLAVILWAINDDPKLFSFKREESPAWKLARLGPGIIDLIESAEAYRKIQSLKSPAGEAQEAELLADARRNFNKSKPWREYKVAGICPKCGSDVITSFFNIAGRSAPIISADCWNAVGENPKCDYNKVL